MRWAEATTESEEPATPLWCRDGPSLFARFPLGNFQIRAVFEPDKKKNRKEKEPKRDKNKRK